MNIAIHGKGLNPADKEFILSFFDHLNNLSINFWVEEHYLNSFELTDYKFPISTYSTAKDLLHFKVQYIISMGGDGTLLDTLNYSKETNLAVLGINLGRLGFLSGTPREKAFDAIESLINGQFSIEKRSLLELHSNSDLFGDLNYALNDFTIHKRDTGSMITIDTYLNGEFFTSYWADGLIVSTPTGSTAYSLSCGGPVILPDSNTFVITPVAPHNLNIRPIIIPDTSVVSFRIKGRGNSHLVSLDSRYEIVDYAKEIGIQKADFYFNILRFNEQHFINTLREKLSWGLDTRNFY